MKKKIFTLAVAVASLFSMSAFAQSPTCAADGARSAKSGATCASANGNCQGQKQGKKADGKKNRDGRKGQKQRGDSTQRQAYNPFEGLNLTAQQQQQIQAIPTPRQVVKTARQGAKDNGQSAKGNAASNKLIRKDVRANYLNEIQAVLTPSQYVQFLENTYVNAPSAKKAKGMKQAKRNGENKDKKSPRQNGGANKGVTAQR